MYFGPKFMIIYQLVLPTRFTNWYYQLVCLQPIERKLLYAVIMTSKLLPRGIFYSLCEIIHQNQNDGLGWFPNLHFDILLVENLSSNNHNLEFILQRKGILGWIKFCHFRFCNFMVQFASSRTHFLFYNVMYSIIVLVFTGGFWVQNHICLAQ